MQIPRRIIAIAVDGGVVAVGRSGGHGGIVYPGRLQLANISPGHDGDLLFFDGMAGPRLVDLWPH